MEVTSIIVLGASGDLAKKKTFPALFDLSLAGLLPPGPLRVLGYARSALSDAAFRASLAPYLTGKPGASPAAIDAFLGLCFYRAGGYDDAAALRALAAEAAAWEDSAAGAGGAAAAAGGIVANRLFYLAVPPTVFTTAAAALSAHARSPRGWNRVVIEKPFGYDSASSAALSAEVARHWDEASVYRIDHYLGKEMVQNLMVRGKTRRRGGARLRFSGARAAQPRASRGGGATPPPAPSAGPPLRQRRF